MPDLSRYTGEICLTLFSIVAVICFTIILGLSQNYYNDRASLAVEALKATNGDAIAVNIAFNESPTADTMAYLMTKIVEKE